MNNKTIVEKYIEAYNSFNTEEMLSCFLETALFENISNTGGSISAKGISEIKKLAYKSKELFISRKQEIIRMHQGDDHIIIEVLYKAVLNIDFSEKFKKGDVLELKGISIFEFKNGKINRLADFS